MFHAIASFAKSDLPPVEPVGTFVETHAGRSRCSNDNHRERPFTEENITNKNQDCSLILSRAVAKKSISSEFQSNNDFRSLLKKEKKTISEQSKRRKKKQKSLSFEILFREVKKHVKMISVHVRARHDCDCVTEKTEEGKTGEV